METEPLVNLFCGRPYIEPNLPVVECNEEKLGDIFSFLEEKLSTKSFHFHFEHSPSCNLNVESVKKSFEEDKNWLRCAIISFIKSLLNKTARLNDIEVLPFQNPDWFEKNFYVKSPGYINVFSSFAACETIPLTRAISNCLLKKKPKHNRESFTDVHFHTSKGMKECKNVLYFSINVVELHWVTIRLDFTNKTITYSEGHGSVPASSILNEIKAFILQLQVLFYLEKKDTDFGTWKYVEGEVDDLPNQENGSDCGVIDLQCTLREYLKQETGSITQNESFRFRRLILTLILNTFSYCYYIGYKEDLGLFDAFPCIPNLFDPRYEITKELLCEKVSEVFRNLEDVFISKMKNMI